MISGALNTADVVYFNTADNNEYMDKLNLYVENDLNCNQVLFNPAEFLKQKPYQADGQLSIFF